MTHDGAQQIASIEHAATVLRIALHILSVRVLTAGVLLVDAGLCAWGMWTESPVRILGAAVFGAIGYAALRSRKETP